MALDVRWLFVLLSIACCLFYAVNFNYILSIWLKLSEIYPLGLRWEERPEK